MFAPESLEDIQQTTAQAAEAKSNAPPKSINHPGTRMAVLEPVGPSIPASPSMSAVDAAIAGRPRLTESEVGYSGLETPRVAGYAFVDAEPTPEEEAYAKRQGHTTEAQENLLESLVPLDPTPNPFIIQDSSAREKLHHKLVDKTAKSNRPSGGRLGVLMGGETPGRTPTPKFLSATNLKKTPGNLTPAAQNLLMRIGTPLRRGSAWDGSGGRKDKVTITGVTPVGKR